MRSLRARLFVVWLLSFAAACAVGLLLLQLYRQSASAQAARADAALADACERIGERFSYYATGWTPPAQAVQDATFRHDLAAVVELALSTSTGVEGGIFDSEAGSLAYAYPTMPAGAAGDVPQAQREHITTLNQLAASSGGAETAQYDTGTQTLLMRACPLRGAHEHFGHGPHGPGNHGDMGDDAPSQPK